MHAQPSAIVRSYFFSNSPVKWRLTKVVFPGMIGCVKQCTLQGKQSFVICNTHAPKQYTIRGVAPSSSQIQQPKAIIIRTSATVPNENQLESRNIVRSLLACGLAMQWKMSESGGLNKACLAGQASISSCLCLNAAQVTASAPGNAMTVVICPSPCVVAVDVHDVQ